jgi:hypothetical protein
MCFLNFAGSSADLISEESERAVSLILVVSMRLLFCLLSSFCPFSLCTTQIYLGMGKWAKKLVDRSAIKSLLIDL